MGIEKSDPMLTGIGLHAYEDSFSHEGFPPAGHAKAGNNPDDPSRDVPKAMNMAKGTYDVLAQYLKKTYGKEPKTKWEDIEGKIKRQFVLGVEEQKLSYNKQVAARIQRWKQQIADDWKEQVDFTYEKKLDPWAAMFEEKAAMVTVPTKK